MRFFQTRRRETIKCKLFAPGFGSECARGRVWACVKIRNFTSENGAFRRHSVPTRTVAVTTGVWLSGNEKPARKIRRCAIHAVGAGVDLRLTSPPWKTHRTHESSSLTMDNENHLFLRFRQTASLRRFAVPKYGVNDPNKFTTKDLSWMKTSRLVFLIYWRLQCCP